MSLFVTQNAVLRSDEFYFPFDELGVAVAGATNSANMRRREDVTVSLCYFRSFFYAINPTTRTHGHFVLSPVALASRDQDGGKSISRENSGL